ncbi:MAG: rhomboid family intramembrane serine protease [Muribaculum sp.]|nr:rhomboid family intramembrane serine protease [Muribaculaceae bacterium]MCM1081420.1 rhomboid family intramembrane serine protease [Muribaculum sp.]
MADIIKILRNKWHYGSLLNRIIYINVAIFLLLHIATFILGMMNSPLARYVLNWLELPSSLSMFIKQPWSILTYMFVQYDIFHLLFNMIWLYWFGQIFMLADTSKRLAALYIYGGIAGGMLFMVAYSVFQINGLLIGSSAAVIAIVTAASILHPDYKVSLFLFGDVAVKWIAVVTIVIDMLSVVGVNSGGHIAHIGGALMGVVFAVMQKKGIDITKPLNKLLDKIVNNIGPVTRRRPTISQHGHYRNISDREQLDMLLDKIRRSGYSSLTITEKSQLNELSRKLSSRQ